MERIVHKTKSFKDAEKYNINQNISMSPEQRQAAVKKIKERVYGKNNPDIREYHKNQYALKKNKNSNQE